MHVLIATDGSELAPAVAVRGLSILSPPDRVTVLTVITSVRIYVDDEEFEGPGPGIDEQDRLWQSQIVEAKSAIARTTNELTGAHIDERIEAGDAGPTICEVARELAVDALVVGSRGRHRRGFLRRGSVAEHVVRHAPCVVLVVREDDRPEPPPSGTGGS
jgi:nucleotide-binding universal stress UspA family protein